MSTFELVFVPLPLTSHFVSVLEMAKLLTNRDERICITFLIMKMPMDTKISSHIDNCVHSRIRFIEVKHEDESYITGLRNSPRTFVFRFVESYVNPVRDAVAKMIENPESNRIAGFVIDMLCTTMIDVANEFGVPAYVFYPTSAANLGIEFHYQSLDDDQFVENLRRLEGSEDDLSIPTFLNPVPARVLPDIGSEDEDLLRMVLDNAKKYRDAKGIVLNTFLEFESHAVKSLSENRNVPQVYPIGPILLHADREGTDQKKQEENKKILEWLDQQPDSSVVYICFGSLGSFERDQVKEIAEAVEQSGHRFLWSLRKPQRGIPGEYENPGEVLPEGFLERTSGIGKIIGWAPQLAILSHRSVGGFVSHCGWNSTLESIWWGVPMAVWPLAAEQQLNAFQLVKEFGMAAEIKMDFRKNISGIVEAGCIENGIKELMDPGNEIRVKVKAMKSNSRMVLMEGGSSYEFLGRFVDDVIGTVS